MKMRNELLGTVVLERLQEIINLAEQAAFGKLQVYGVEISFTAIIKKEVGLSTPTLWFLPANLVKADAEETWTQRVTFVLERKKDLSMSQDALSQDIERAVGMVSAGIEALAPLQNAFKSTARVELEFEVSAEGRVEFIAKAGAGRTDQHTLTLMLTPRVPVSTAQASTAQASTAP
jgi:hypothetical protein